MTINIIIVKLTYYPRLWLEFVADKFLKKDFSILDPFRNQPVLVVGNGPSLNDTELNKIGGVHIGMNKINMIFERKNWTPDIIVCVNGLVIKQNLEFFNSTEIPLILPVKAFFLGVKPRKNVILLRKKNTLEFSEDLNKGLIRGSTVTTNALQIAGYIDASEIRIVGVDHSFSFKGSKTNITRMEEDDKNHFDPNYFKGQLWGHPDLEGSEKAYSRARVHFDKKGTEIVDYTINGKLQIFEKGDINKIYS